MRCTEPCCAGRWRKRFYDWLRLLPSFLLTLYGVFELSIPCVLVGVALAVMQNQGNRMMKKLENRPWY